MTLIKRVLLILAVICAGLYLFYTRPSFSVETVQIIIWIFLPYLVVLFFTRDEGIVFVQPKNEQTDTEQEYKFYFNEKELVKHQDFGRKKTVIFVLLILFIIFFLSFFALISYLWADEVWQRFLPSLLPIAGIIGLIFYINQHRLNYREHILNKVSTNRGLRINYEYIAIIPAVVDVDIRTWLQENNIPELRIPWKDIDRIKIAQFYSGQIPYDAYRLYLRKDASIVINGKEFKKFIEFYRSQFEAWETEIIATLSQYVTKPIEFESTVAKYKFW